MKRFISALLILAFALSLAPMAGAAEVVVPSTQKFALDGKAVSMEAYNIDGNNFVMLRSLAGLLSGTERQFSVSWDGKTRTVSLETGKAYEAEPDAVNGPVILTDDQGRVTNAVKSSQTLVIDGKTVSGISAYNIGGNNFFKLADLRPYLGYGLDYTESTRTVSISTASVSDALTLVAAEDYDAIRACLAAVAKNSGTKRGGGITNGVDIAVEESAAEAVPAPAAPAADAAEAEPASENSAEYSGTNVQVEGIDEGDVVKTDGQYLYILRNGQLILAEADGRNTKVLSSTAIKLSDEGEMGWRSKEPKELYISGNRVAVLSACYEDGNGKDGRWQSREYTAIDVFDVSDPAHPRAVADLGQDGWDMGSRLKDGVLYLVTNYSVYSYDEKDPMYYVPRLYVNDMAEPVSAGDVYLCPEASSTRYVVVTAYDLELGEATATQSLLGGGDNLYMSHDSIYVADSHYKETAGTPRKHTVYTVVDHSNEMVTDLVRFSLTGGLTVAANGTIPGRLDDQFSMDEYNGYLRLVTTAEAYSYTVYTDEEMGFTNYKWEETDTSSNGLYILDRDLSVTGKVTDLAPGERIYSARFDGDVAYFCTFRNVDPLFAVDVSDPAAPKVLSALKISGFSDYLHPWADGLLFGAGYEADEDTGRTEGIKLVMFDTSDKTNVVVKSAKGTDLDWSEAMSNHHAFLISREKNLIAFPADDQYVFFGYDEARGFYPQASVDLEGWNWEARGLYIGDMIYVVGCDTIYVIDMDGFDLVRTVDLPVD